MSLVHQSIGDSRRHVGSVFYRVHLEKVAIVLVRSETARSALLVVTGVVGDHKARHLLFLCLDQLLCVEGRPRLIGIPIGTPIKVIIGVLVP
jgi:hypothetical protein